MAAEAVSLTFLQSILKGLQRSPRIEADPAAMQFTERLEQLGFFFGGIIPEKDKGDVLRLQYLNNVAIDPSQIQVASDFGKELLAYVLQAQAAAGQRRE